MKCGDNKYCSKSKTKGKIQHRSRPNTDLDKIRVRSGALEEYATSADRSHTPCALCRYMENDISNKMIYMCKRINNVPTQNNTFRTNT